MELQLSDVASILLSAKIMYISETSNDRTATAHLPLHIRAEKRPFDFHSARHWQCQSFNYYHLLPNTILTLIKAPRRTTTTTDGKRKWLLAHYIYIYI